MSLPGFVNFRVDIGDFFDPQLPLLMLHIENLVERPMKVVRNVRYLLSQALHGVAYNSPVSPPIVIVNL